MLGRIWRRIWKRREEWKFFWRAIEVSAVIAALVTFYIDMGERQEERLARMWNLATSDRPGNSGKIPALEFLNGKGKPLAGISIKFAYLVGVKLQGANLSGANLSHANLRRADLSEANLSEANLRWANFIGADLRGADLSRAYLSATKLSNAKLSSVINLTQKQLETAWPAPPPKSLPEGLTWPFVEQKGKWVRKD